MWTGIERLRHWLKGRTLRTEATAEHTARALKVFPDGSRVEFGFGNFDEWCVFVTRPDRPRHAPRDTEYFAELKFRHAQFPRVLDDFVEVFQQTTKAIDATVLARITEIASQYPAAMRMEINLLLTTLYAAMLAEENRAHAPLGKRIKRLGVHQVLVEGMAVGDAAQFSRGRPWRELAEECARRGF